MARERLPEWTLRTLELTFLTLRLGKLQNAKYYKALAAKKDKVHVAAGEEEPQDMRGGAQELKRLRNVADNGLLLATLYQLEDENKWRLKVLVEVSRPVVDFQGLFNQRARCVEGAFQLQRDMCHEDILRTCAATVSVLQSPESLDRLRLLRQHDCEDAGHLQEGHPLLVQADDLSALAARFAVRLVAWRVRKYMDMLRGYPRRLVLLASDEAEHRRQAMNAFRADAVNYEEALKQPFTNIKALVARSVFKLVAVQQYIRLCEAGRGRVLSERG